MVFLHLELDLWYEMRFLWCIFFKVLPFIFYGILPLTEEFFFTSQEPLLVVSTLILNA